MTQATANAKITRVIDSSLSAQGSTLFVVLFDTGAFVIEVQRRINVCGKYAGTEAAWGATGDVPVKAVGITLTLINLPKSGVTGV